MKSNLGGEIHWSVTAHSVFWAEYVTILKLTGLLLYFMVHGIKPLFFLLIYPRQCSLSLCLILTTFIPLSLLFGKLINFKNIRRIQTLLSANEFFSPSLHHSDTLSCNSRPGFTSTLSPWWSHLSLQLLDQEGVKLKDEAMLPRPNGGPSQDYWRIILAAIQMVQIELGLARIGSRPVKSRSRLRVLQPS